MNECLMNECLMNGWMRLLMNGKITKWLDKGMTRLISEEMMHGYMNA